MVLEIKGRECNGKNAAVAKLLDVSTATIHDLLAGKKGAGLKLLQNLARHKGVSEQEILGETVPGTFQQVPGWAEAVQELREQQPWLPQYAIDRVAYTNALHHSQVTWQMIARMAAAWIDLDALTSTAPNPSAPDKRKVLPAGVPLTSEPIDLGYEALKRSQEGLAPVPSLRSRQPASEVPPATTKRKR
jgi:hypothetical protein